MAIALLEALFDLFEEHLDVPAAAIQVAHRARAPREVVGDELHHAPFVIDFHPGLNPPDPHALVFSLEHHDLVLDDVLVAHGEVPYGMVFHCVLGPRDPLHATCVKFGKVGEIHVGLVKNHDFTGGNARADLAGALVVVLPGGIDDGKGWQEAVQIEPQVHLCRRLAPAVFRPVHAIGHQLHRGRVHRVDPDFEAAQQTLALAPGGEVGTGVLEVAHHRPEELFDEIRAAFLVGVGKGVAGRRGHTEP